MSDDRVTVIMSDLHVGGGSADPGDDHIYQGGQLVRLLDQLATQTPEGLLGRTELIFNGDFLEFAQVNTAAYSHPSDRHWCSESESLAKLETIVGGHPEIFAALARFQDSGNLVTIAAGNHDVDLCWPAVQQRLRAVAGAGLRFETGAAWVERHDGRLQIGHGHMADPANRFEHWDTPIRPLDGGGEPRLEMCPGTLFMVKFVNRLESRYPFADNLLPVTKLVSVLLRDDKAGLASVAWVFLKFVGSTSPAVLQTGASDDVGALLLERARDDAAFRAAVDAALAQAGLTQSLALWRARPADVDTLATVMLDLLGRIDEATWKTLFETHRSAATLGADDDVTLSALVRGGFEDGKKKLRVAAQDRVDETGARVVVMGHTHQVDQFDLDGGGVYFNPGCWTRYLELKPGQKVTLDDLKDESRYPYALNYVRVAPGADGTLDARLVCFERS